jgi:hypothetical protein
VGVSSASQVLHRMVGLTLDHAVNAAKQHAEKNGPKDASWLSYAHSETSSKQVGQKGQYWDRRESLVV